MAVFLALILLTVIKEGALLCQLFGWGTGDEPHWESSGYQSGLKLHHNLDHRGWVSVHPISTCKYLGTLQNQAFSPAHSLHYSGVDCFYFQGGRFHHLRQKRTMLIKSTILRQLIQFLGRNKSILIISNILSPKLPCFHT